MEIEERVAKTVRLFDKNVRLAEGLGLTEGEGKVLDLARMYASDTLSFMRKKDYVTAFSSIEYAHGLLDAVLKLRGKDPYDDDK